jgi:hypothetical protein
LRRVGGALKTLGAERRVGSDLEHMAFRSRESISSQTSHKAHETVVHLYQRNRNNEYGD